MAAIDLIGFAFWVQLGIQQVSTRSIPNHSSLLPQQPASSAGGQL
jgi:hypothetical protein